MEYARLGKSMLQVSRFCMDIKDWGAFGRNEVHGSSQEEMRYLEEPYVPHKMLELV